MSLNETGTVVPSEFFSYLKSMLLFQKSPCKMQAIGAQSCIVSIAMISSSRPTNSVNQSNSYRRGVNNITLVQSSKLLGISYMVKCKVTNYRPL